MAEVVDAIIGEMTLKIDQYRQNALAVIQINKDLRKSVLDAGGDDAAVEQSANRQIASRRKQTDAEKAAAKETAAAAKQAAKEASDAAKESAKERADAAKAAAKAEADAAKEAVAAKRAVAEAERQLAVASAASTREQIENLERLKAAEREASNQAKANAFLSGGGQRPKSARASAAVFRENFKAEAVAAPTAGPINPTPTIYTQPGNDKTQAEYDAQLARTQAARAAVAGNVPVSVASTTADAGEVAARKEINHLALDTYDTTQKLKLAEGETAVELGRELEYLRLIGTYKAKGLTDTEALIRAEATLAEFDRIRAETAEKQVLTSRKSGSNTAVRFAEGAGLGRTGGSLPAIGGIVAAGAVAGVAELAKQGLEYAQTLKQDSDQLGLTTRDLQIYRAAAQTAGLTTEQLKEGVGQLGDNLGKAQEGSKAQSLIFQRLHIDIGSAATGYKSLSDILPSLSDRLSQITDKTQRQAIEQALGGEQLRKMDPILSQGAAAFDAYGKSIERAGGILSSSEINRSAETAKKIALLNDQLQRDLASTVSNNAKSIEDLATAFFRLADGALKAFGYLRQVDNLDVINGGLSVRVREGITGTSQSVDKQQAYTGLLETPQGRKALLDRNTQQLNALNLADKGGGLSGPGLDDVGDNPQSRYAAHQKALAERATILRVQKAYDAKANQGQAAVQPGHPDGNVLAGPDKKGPKGKSPEDLAEAEIERTRQFNDQLASLQEESLRAQESMTGSIQERAADEKKLADAQYDKKIGDINAQLAKQLEQIAKDYPKGGNAKFAQEAKDHAATLITAAGAARDGGQRARDQQTAADTANALNQHAQTQLSISSDMLNDQLALAKTTSERREIEAKLLDIAKQREKNDLTTQLKTLKPGSPEAQDVQAKLDNVDTDYALKGKANDRTNASPLQAYANSLPGTGKEINEALEGAAVDGAKQLNDALDDSVKKMLHLHGIAGDILNDFIKIGLQAAEKQIFGALLGGATGGAGGGLGGFISSIFGGGKATGGPVNAGTTYLIGEKGPELLTMGSAGHITPNNAITPNNSRVAPPAVSGPVVYQTIQYSGAVDIADKSYVNEIAQAQHRSTLTAIQQSSAQTLRAVPQRMKNFQTRGN